jgi:hypothetical protein
MGESQKVCTFCDSTESLVTESEFPICDSCAEAYREILETHLEDEEEIFGFRPVDYNYTPSDGEVMFFEPSNSFYRVEVSREGEPMLYLQPLPSNEPAVPITEMADELSSAIADDKFHQVGAEENAVTEHMIWWASAISFAPTPSTDSESSTESPTADGPELELDEEAETDKTDDIPEELNLSDHTPDSGTPQSEEPPPSQAEGSTANSSQRRTDGGSSR